jgi:hypothetical protein
MMLRPVQFIALLLSCLALSTTSAHVLEYPQKISLDIETYTIINAELYKYFAIVGGLYCIGALLASLWLAVMARKEKRVFRWSLAGFIFHTAWLVSWLTMVQPVNSRVEGAMKISIQSASTVWSAYRMQWEWGHITGFVFHLAAFCSLLIGAFLYTRNTRS